MHLKHRALAAAAMAASLAQPALAQSGVTPGATSGVTLYGQVDAFVGSTRASGGERTIPLDGFFKGFYETDLKANEILTSVRVPVPEAGTGARKPFA